MDLRNEDELLSLKFQTRAELLVRVRAFYSTKGYALSILRSKPEKYVVLRCDRGGQYRNTHKIAKEQRKRETGSRLINCPFQLYGKKLTDDMWVVKTINNSHNHEASTDTSGHPSLRRLTGKEIEVVEHMSNTGAPPRQILSSLCKENPSTRAISKAIYNAKTKMQKRNLGGKTLIQALFEELGQEGYMYNILHDEVGHITHLFLADPQSIMLSKSFSNVFIMDCTYKTNKYKMPLLDIIGITSFNTSFYSSFVFLKKESTENYVWALEMFKTMLGQENWPSVIITDRELALMNAISIVFPAATNIICIWHINKNILGKCKSFFQTQDDWDKFMSDWQHVMYSTTKEEYHDNLRKFESTYREKTSALKYIKGTWLPLKEKFVSAWTNEHLHLGNRTSSRAEGAHAKLKKYLKVSTDKQNSLVHESNLQIIKTKICLAVENEFNEIRVQLAREKLQVPHACNIPFFKNLIFRISLFALRELHKQYELAKSGTMHPICTGQFMATMGLPCAHQMRNWKTGTLSLDQIHGQWRLDTREFHNLGTNSVFYPDEQMKSLLDQFYKEYLKWPLNRKQVAHTKIQEFVNQSDVLFEPTIPSQKNQHQTSKRKRALSSTRRDPSQFEVAEARWRSGSSSEVIHSNQAHQSTYIATPEFEVPATIDDDSVFYWIDSNI